MPLKCLAKAQVTTKKKMSTRSTKDKEKGVKIYHYKIQQITKIAKFEKNYKAVK